MHNKRNVIVMFLLIMLSFAIISEVSAASEAEINGTGPDLSMMPSDIKHDIAGERFNENSMHDHADDFPSHDEQKSFNKTPAIPGDNKCNENLYEHEMDECGDLNQTMEFKSFDMQNPDGDNKPSDFKSAENFTSFDFNEKPMGGLNNSNLRNSNFTDLINNGELMSDVVSNLIGLNNISPNFKKDDMKVSPNKLLTGQEPIGKKNNESAPLIPGEKNSSDTGTVGIDKNPKILKKDKKSKNLKKSPKKVKSIKKSKKLNKKHSKKERVKL